MLEIEHVRVTLRSEGRSVTPVRDVSYRVEAGSVMGVVGESGSGKTVLHRALFGLVHAPATLSGHARFEQQRVDLSQRDLRTTLGAGTAFVFQDAASSLNPVRTVGSQLREALASAGRPHDTPHLRAALDDVRLGADSAALLRKRSYELSGGMAQRVAIALALATGPRLLIADEPTTALDVVTKRGILDTLRALVDRHALAMVFISHDFDAVTSLCDDVVVMYGGLDVERSPVSVWSVAPRHPYSRRLRQASVELSDRPLHEIVPMPGRPPPIHQPLTGCPLTARGCVRAGQRCEAALPEHTRPAADVIVRCFDPHPATPDRRAERATTIGATDPSGQAAPLLEVRNLTYGYPALGFARRRTAPNVLHDVSFDVPRGARVGLIGASGSGKSTILRLLLRLETPPPQRVRFDGTDLNLIARRTLAARIQVVFQVPQSVANPKHTVERILREPRLLLGLDADAATTALEPLLERVGLAPKHLTAHPHQLSGGELQRVMIARALTTRPDLLLLDEPTSSLDVSIQLQILTLLDGIVRERGLSCLLVSHDLSVVTSFCDEVIVLEHGRIVERGPAERVLHAPQHAYTAGLVDAARQRAPRTAA